jgi:hypothetical protein
MHFARKARPPAIAVYAAIAVTAIAGSSAAPALAAGAENDGHVLQGAATNVVLEIHDVDPQTGACTHQDPTTGRCSIPFFEIDNLTGDIAGHQQQSGGLSVTPASVGQAVSLATFTGTVKGCPEPGTAMFRSVTAIGVKAKDGSVHNVGTVEVVPGSGTGGLSNLEGHGDTYSTLTANGPVSTGREHLTCTSGHHD